MIGLKKTIFVIIHRQFFNCVFFITFEFRLNEMENVVAFVLILLQFQLL